MRRGIAPRAATPEDCIDVGHDEYGVCAPF